MSDLLRIVQHLPGIYRVSHQDYPLVLNQTWEWLNRGIDEFQMSYPDQSESNKSLENALVRWINGYLKWRIRDLYFPRGKENDYLDLLNDEIFNQSINYDYIQQQEDNIISMKIENWIVSDPEKKLESCYIKNLSHCNCKELAYRLLIKSPPDNLSDISRDIDVSYQTLFSHWKRNCLCLLRDQAMVFGYERD
jgi:hypothetical protein